jgi:copper chaperone CopZ
MDSSGGARSKEEIAIMDITRLVRLILVFAGLIVISLAVGWRLSASPVPQNGSQTNANQKTVQMRIAGMTCASCAKGLEASLRNMAGVVKVTVDYKAGQAVVTFDTSKQSAQSLSKFVASCGYKVKETKVV